MRALKSVVIIILILSMIDLVGAESKGRKLADDQFQISFSEIKNDSIRILQLTDLHLGNKRGWDKSFKTMDRVNKLVRIYQPDVIAITGDLFTGEKLDSEALAAFARLAFDDFQRPWFFTFGNHDPGGGEGREPIRQIFSKSEWGILGYHSLDSGSIKCDYLINLLSKKSDVPVWQLFAFDSGSEPGHKSIKKDQVDWFRQQSDLSKKEYSQVIPAVAFFHIPLKQFQDLWYDSTLLKSGVLHEKVMLEEDDGSVYQAFLDEGNIKACFCGHDHDNNYWGKYLGGILLSYGHVSGDAGYRRHWPPGAKLISLPLRKGEIGIKDIVLE